MEGSGEERARYVHEANELTHSFLSAIEKGFSRGVMEEFYDAWAANYDEDHHRTGNVSVHQNRIPDYVEKFGIDKHARILDVACGTGKVGRFLKQKGFSNVDGVDGSSGMLQVARQDNLYQNYFQEFIDDQPIGSVQTESYDAVVTTGSFIRGHLTAKCLRPMGLCLKKGGLLIMSMRSVILDQPDFQDMVPTMTKLEQEGFWRLREKFTVENYLDNTPGVTFVFEKTTPEAT